MSAKIVLDAAPRHDHGNPLGDVVYEPVNWVNAEDDAVIRDDGQAAEPAESGILSALRIYGMTEPRYPTQDAIHETLNRLSAILADSSLSLEWRQEAESFQKELMAARNNVGIAKARCDEAIIDHDNWVIEEELEKKSLQARSLEDYLNQVKSEINELQHKQDLLRQTTLAAFGVR